MAPTVLRYPGGTHADVYHWEAGMGPLEERGRLPNRFDGREQTVTFGTREFLQLCAATGAEPLITVNILSGTPEEAAAWVRLTNITRLQAKNGDNLPTVRFWEIGNEPYLKDEHNPQWDIEPAEYVARANAFIRAMRAVDPSIQVGIPLQNHQLGGVPFTAYPDYTRTVLDGLTEPVDFVSVHNAYRPLLTEWPVADEDMVLATLAGYRSVADDFALTRQLLDDCFPGQDIPIALTEYNTLYGIGVEPADSYINSLTSALYTADILHLLAEQGENILMANYWSLSENWYFGAISFAGNPRPAYHVLQVYGEMLRGERLPVEVESPVFSNPAVGFVPAYDDTPVLRALALRHAETLRLFIIHKGLESELMVDISNAACVDGGECAAFDSVNIRVFTGESPLAGVVPFYEEPPGAVGWVSGDYAAAGFPLTLTLLPHSITVIEILQ
jgi:alpha-N-arabinofuranosidase